MLKRCATRVVCQLKHSRCRYSSGANNTVGDAKARLGFIGVPFSKGQGKGGVEKAPSLLREHGLVPLLEQVSYGKQSSTNISAFVAKCN